LQENGCAGIDGIDGGEFPQSCDRVPTLWEVVGTLWGPPVGPVSTAKGRCLHQLLAVHFDSMHRPEPMSSRLPSPCLARWMWPCLPWFLGNCLAPYLIEIGHGVIIKIGFIGWVPSWWTSRDPSGISGLCSGRFDLHHGHRAAKPESARMPFGLRSASGRF